MRSFSNEEYVVALKKLSPDAKRMIIEDDPDTPTPENIAEVLDEFGFSIERKEMFWDIFRPVLFGLISGSEMPALLVDEIGMSEEDANRLYGQLETTYLKPVCAQFRAGERTMEELKVFQEGDIAVTTHRIVWGDDVFSFDDIEHVLFLDNDVWKGLAIGIGVGFVGLAIAQPWSIFVGLAVFGLTLWFWINRKDEIMITFNDGGERRFLMKSKTGLFNRIREAKNKRDALVRDRVGAANRQKANAALSEIDSLPDD